VSCSEVAVTELQLLFKKMPNSAKTEIMCY